MKTYPVRKSAKAIIFHNGRLLAMKHQKGSDVFYTLPGGGQNHNEDLHSTLKREWLEVLLEPCNLTPVKNCNFIPVLTIDAKDQ